MLVEFGQASAEGAGQHPYEENICLMYAADAVFISFALVYLIVFGGAVSTSLFPAPLPPLPIEIYRTSECDAVVACLFPVLLVTYDYGKSFRLISKSARSCLVECGEKGANAPRCVEL
jgi:hypothetical protein